MTFPIDRHALAEELGFAAPSSTSIDAVSDRDFTAEFVLWAALTGGHLNRLAEAVILFSSAEFGYFKLSDAFSTGSSLMPQKNPDVFELARGKAGTLVGSLAGMLATLKGLPSAYDKDLQEDKLPAFAACDTLLALLPVVGNALSPLMCRPSASRSKWQKPTLQRTRDKAYVRSASCPEKKVGTCLQRGCRRSMKETRPCKPDW